MSIQTARSQRVHRGRVVRDEEEGALLLERADEAHALLLEGGVADRQDLVDDQDVGVDMGADREGEARIHAAGIGLDRLVDEVADAGEGLDVVEARVDLVLRQPEERGGEVHVLAAGEFRVEACAELQQGANPAPDVDVPVEGGACRQQLQQRRLAGAVAADDADGFLTGDREGHVLEGPNIPGRTFSRLRQIICFRRSSGLS